MTKEKTKQNNWEWWELELFEKMFGFALNTTPIDGRQIAWERQLEIKLAVYDKKVRKMKKIYAKIHRFLSILNANGKKNMTESEYLAFQEVIRTIFNI